MAGIAHPPALARHGVPCPTWVSFIGPVAIARFAAVEPPKGRQPDGTGSEAGPPGQVLGMLLLLTGVALRLQDRGSVTMLVLVAVFQLMTSPVAAHMVGSTGLPTGKVDPELLKADDGGATGPDAGR